MFPMNESLNLTSLIYFNKGVRQHEGTTEVGRYCNDVGRTS
jgi:hypothetical protein